MRIAYVALIELDIPNACLIHSREIAEQMVELGHEVDMFLPLPLKPQKWQGMKHHWIRFWGFDAWRRWAFLIQLCFRLWKEHRRKAFDCIYMRELEGAKMLCDFVKYLEIPLFVEVNGWLLDDLRLVDASEAMLEKAESNQAYLMQSACGVIASTLGNTENVKKHYYVQHVMTQELGVNAELFANINQAYARKHLKLQPETTYILFAGSFHPHHDLKTLIQAFACMQEDTKDVSLILVGDGAQYDIAKAWVKQAGVGAHVDFMGSQPYEDMPYWFSAANLLISPLIQQKIKQQNGALATKVWEGMAAATPVLVTDIQGTKSYDLLSKLAWVCAPEDVQSMAACMRDALENHDEARVSQSQTYVLKERSWKKAASDSIDFMRECMRDCS